jgi:hypothetical protein
MSLKSRLACEIYFENTVQTVLYKNSINLNLFFNIFLDYFNILILKINYFNVFLNKKLPLL